MLSRVIYHKCQFICPPNVMTQGYPIHPPSRLLSVQSLGLKRSSLPEPLARGWVVRVGLVIYIPTLSPVIIQL